MSLETFNHDELLQEVKLILDGSHPTYKGKDGAGRFLRHVGRDFNSLDVTTCNRNGLDLQSSRFSTGIDCVYPSQQTGIICE